MIRVPKLFQAKLGQTTRTRNDEDLALAKVHIHQSLDNNQHQFRVGLEPFRIGRVGSPRQDLARV